MLGELLVEVLVAQLQIFGSGLKVRVVLEPKVAEMSV